MKKLKILLFLLAAIALLPEQSKIIKSQSKAALSSIVTSDEPVCPEGKFLNPSETSTGKTITTYDPETGEGTTVKICNEGYTLNVETNRCNKNKENSDSSPTVTSTVKTCPEGKFLNPKTNRCKNLETVTELSTGKTITTYDPNTGEATTIKVCNDGYDLDIETNRCKKHKENKGEDYELEVQFRHEIKKFFKRIVRGKKT